MTPAHEPTKEDLRSTVRRRRLAASGISWWLKQCRWLAAMIWAGGLGCTQEMYDQPRYEPYEASKFFSDGASARHPVEGTVARGQLWADDPFFTGKRDGKPVAQIPNDPRTRQALQVTHGTLQRGRQQFDVFCAPCHGRTGHGDGMVVRRGFRSPPSLHEARLRDQEPLGHFFDVMTIGFKTMPAYADRIPAEDRWAIAAYIRALQTSQYVILADAPDEIRSHFMADAPR